MKVITFLHNIRAINQFVLKPTDSCLSDISLTKKLSVFSTAFLYNIVMGGFLGITILYLIDRFLFRIENNMEASAANLFAIVLLAPLMEEIIFRLPLRYRDNYLIAPIEAIFNINLHLYWRRYFHFTLQPSDPRCNQTSSMATY